ncbi:MAG: twin-arginine translocase TatA/TatE family subunit [Gammaproteobacteria bacterium]|jgi:sec-independent protein translocase protein TatA|uniref:Sec-independent protein translocase protein TatA n=1 Tax=SAR86 cluster bacterium TaxID=2030880 RepID=A0A520MU98_9GAMM|nr:twin-arginine translocase TatA/TatE family subunit [Rhodobiaceae bacterium]RPG42556.1 MAG: twin-arginine translocase TatA/TatE family subunit [Gammaproteobacteria bacterium TMED112]RZO24756.1 MAG: twin-arginine translocase TatA/TatE family subunit [SAR86 cluster bacterium]|tara:strand:+ start:25108 stop:25266 length:159 start_codon:yes stop_codon:yes gene_type:complete
MSIGFWQILVVLLLILVIFGSSRIKSVGSDLGKAFKGFKKEIKEEDDPDRDS